MHLFLIKILGKCIIYSCETRAIFEKVTREQDAGTGRFLSVLWKIAPNVPFHYIYEVFP